MAATADDEARDSPAPVPSGTTADPAADALRSVRADLDAVDSADLADQPAIFERMHATLTEALDATAHSSEQ